MPSSEGPSKEKLLQSIGPKMQLMKSFFGKIYGYEIGFPEFAETALSKLEAAGCGRAREYYADWVDAYEREYSSMLKSVAEWYSKQDFYNKEVRRQRTR